MGCAGSGHRGDVETSSVVRDGRCASVTPVESEVLYSRNGSAYKKHVHTTQSATNRPQTRLHSDLRMHAPRSFTISGKTSRSRDGAALSGPSSSVRLMRTAVRPVAPADFKLFKKDRKKLRT